MSPISKIHLSPISDINIFIMYARDSEKRLINAVSNIIEQDGFSKLGVNRIAREAGCDKVLIYRYFNGLDGLLSAWASQNDFYTIAYDTFYEEAKSAQKEDVKKLTKKVLISQLRFLRENRMMQELILWELSGSSKFRIIQDIREKNGQKLQDVFNQKLGFNNEDISLYITVLVTAIEFIVLYTRQYHVFNGISFLHTDSWAKLETVINNYVDMLFINFEI